MRGALSACLERDPRWVERSKRALADIRYASTSLIRPEAVASRRAFDLAAASQTRLATDRLGQVINEIENPATRGWLKEQQAAYLHLTDPVDAQKLLAGAGRENGFVLRPAAGITPARFKSAAVQARAAAEFLAGEYSDGISLVLGVHALLEEIQWDEERTDDAERAWEHLGRHLAFASSRPEKLYGTGPDNLWGLAPDRHAVTELKTGCATSTIAKKDLDQLGRSVRWGQQQSPDVTAVPVIVHPSRMLDQAGTSVPGMRVVTPGKLDQLKLAVRAYATGLADGQGRWHDETAVKDHLARNKLDAAAIFQVYAESPQAS